MRIRSTAPILCVLIALGAVAAQGQETYSWRYYRPGNTGIQGDFNEALWVGPDGDPYIGGYEPSFEEGGFAKFVQSEDRWLNYSNVDHLVMGHPDDQGKIRITDIVPDASGKLWMSTWRGVMGFDPAIGASSLVRYAPGNSQIRNEFTGDVERAPDGTMWFPNAGMVRYNPGTNQWTRWTNGSRFAAAQPKPGGGYILWSSNFPEYNEGVMYFDSGTQTWTIVNTTGAPGEIMGMPGKDCVDDAGNFWAIRSTAPGDWPSLDYRRMDGTWISPPEPYPSMAFSAWAFKAYGNGKALFVDGNSVTWRFDGGSWSSLGQWKDGAYTDAVDTDAAGNVWVVGVGGAAKRDNVTGTWQRYRITNTGNSDSFNGDLTIDPVHGFVYTTANAGPGVGGMTRFDGERWVSWNQATYGLGYDWPFPNDNSHALAYRPSTGMLAVSPTNWIYGVHEWTGSGFEEMPGLNGAQALCEDSMGRLWALGEYYRLDYNDGVNWNTLPLVGWGLRMKSDPSRAGTVWATTDNQILRTDGSYVFSRTPEDFPGSAAWFTGLVADQNDVAWVGTWSQFTSTGSTLIRLDANTGAYQIWDHDAGWPFPGEHVRPLAKTADGRLWMHYDSEYPSTDSGLCWWDGVNVGSFPAPFGGVPQWGGLPHAQINDLEVRTIAGGYELWMSFASRGLGVLTVLNGTTDVVGNTSPTARIQLAQNQPNPFRSDTEIRFDLPRAESVRLEVFDVAGRLVRRLLDETLSPGSHQTEWDGTADSGEMLPSGVYHYRLSAGSDVVERKMVRLQ